MFGIEDVFVWLGYLLCLGSTVLCVVYALSRWNRGDEPAKPADVAWAQHETRAEQEL